MLENNPQDWDLGAWILSGGLGGLGGALSYCVKIVEGKPFSFAEFLIYTAVSAFSGLLAFLAAVGFGQSEFVAGALSGTAGYLGTRAWKIVEIIAKKKYDVDISFGANQ